MKTIVSAAIASLVLVSGAPAFAQYGPPPQWHGPPADAPRGWELNRRLDWLQQRIERGRADGSLDWREGRRVQRELIHIRREEDMLRDRNGGRLSDRDRMMLQDRLDRLSDRIRWLRHNDERRPW